MEVSPGDLVVLLTTDIIARSVGLNGEYSSTGWCALMLGPYKNDKWWFFLDNHGKLHQESEVLVDLLFVSV